MAKMLTVALFLFLGFLIANKVVVRAQAAQAGDPHCASTANTAHQKSLGSGFSEAGSRSQAENTLARCLIDN